MTRVSVVIPTRNKASRLRLALASLASQRGTPHFDVVVVDDGCTDDTPKVLAAYGTALSLRRVRGPQRGRAAARNAGARASTSDLLIFLDDDIVVGPGCVEAHRQAHNDGRALVHGRLRELPGSSSALAGRRTEHVLRPEVLASDGLRLDDVRNVATALEQTIEILFRDGVPSVAPWILSVGANLSIERCAWHGLGGFDEAFGRCWGCEDIEFGYRAVAAGLRPRFAPAAYGGHLTHARPAAWEQHELSLRRFRELHRDPEVVALELLLAPSGSAASYLAALGFAADDAGPRD